MLVVVKLLSCVIVIVLVLVIVLVCMLVFPEGIHNVVFVYLLCMYLLWLRFVQSDKLQEQQDIIAELQSLQSTPGLMSLGPNLKSRPHTAPLGSVKHTQNGGINSQVTYLQSLIRLV